MNIRQMNTLVAVVETGSFAAAGDRVGLSHSAVSLQIKSMEDEFGVQLFDRSVRPPTPTIRGRLLADHARKTIAMFEASSNVAKGDVVRGRLVVGAVPTALASFLPSALAALKTLHPDLKIDIRSGGSQELANQLLNGSLDIVVCTKPEKPVQGLDWYLIAKEPFVVIAPVECQFETYEELLSKLPFIWFNRKTWAGSGIENELKVRGISVNATMEIDALDAIASMVREGLGVSIVPVCVGTQPNWDGLATVPFGDPPYEREVGALTASGSVPDAMISAFLDVLNAPQ